MHIAVLHKVADPDHTRLHRHQITAGSDHLAPATTPPEGTPPKKGEEGERLWHYTIRSHTFYFQGTELYVGPDPY